MKCKYCRTDFHAEHCATEILFHQAPRYRKGDDSSAVSYYAFTQVCSKCLGAHIEILERPTDYRDTQFLAIPRAGAGDPAPVEVPASIAQDYTEANLVLSLSAKASAALSRRCLQAILSAHGYIGRDLMKQIEAALAETDARKALPTSLRENIDAIRNFGNFSAHPITDQTTLQVVEVEEGEAEWCLQLLLDMFDHFYVAPARAAERRVALAEKLSAAGKPPMR